MLNTVLVIGCTGGKWVVQTMDLFKYFSPYNWWWGFRKWIEDNIRHGWSELEFCSIFWLTNMKGLESFTESNITW